MKKILDEVYLIQQYLEGRSCRSLARELGIAESTVANRIKEKGLSVRKDLDYHKGKPSQRRWIPESPEMVIQAYSQGRTLAEIGRQFNVNRITVGAFLCRNGIKPRKKSGILRLVPVYAAVAVISHSGYSFDTVCGIFSTEKKAQDYLDAGGGDEFNPEEKKVVKYEVNNP